MTDSKRIFVDTRLLKSVASIFHLKRWMLCNFPRLFVLDAENF